MPTDPDSDNVYGYLNPRGGGDPIPMQKRKLLIGRRSRCDITLEFKNVSSHHCELELINGYWRVRDMGSTNGIKVNGDRCDSRWLKPGDVLHVAKHLFEIDYEPLGDAPPPIDLDEEENVIDRGLLEKAGLERASDLDEPPVRSARQSRSGRTRSEERLTPPPLPPKLDMDD